MDSMVAVALAVVLVSGLIAYIGDWVGRKMGRKRLTLFGLRPRHTAVVVSVGAGMLISTLTLTLSFAVSKVVRDAFVTPIGRLKSDLQATRAELTDIQGRSAETQAQFGQANERLSTSQYNLNVAEARLSHIEQALTAKNRDVAQATARLTEATARLARARAEYDRVRADLGVSQARLQASARQLGALSTQVHGLQYESAALVAQRDAMDAQVKELRLVVSEFARVNFARLAFTAGQELLTGLLPAGDPDARRDWMVGFLGSAEAVARQQCPRLAEDAEPIAYIDSAGGGLRRLTRAEATAMLVARAGRTGAGPLIIRLTPANNTPEDGPVLLVVDAVEMAPDAPAYARGAVIARSPITVTSATERGEILRAVMDDLLRRQLPLELRAAGLVAATRRYDPRRPGAAPDPATPQVSWGEIMAAVDRVAAGAGRLEVRVIATAATTRFGPPAMALDVAPVP